MSGVIAAMRRTLLSCTSLARDGLIAFGAAALLSIAPAHADEASLLDTISGFLDLNRQEFAVLTTALASGLASVSDVPTAITTAREEPAPSLCCQLSTEVAPVLTAWLTESCVMSE